MLVDVCMWRGLELVDIVVLDVCMSREDMHILVLVEEFQHILCIV